MRERGDLTSEADPTPSRDCVGIRPPGWRHGDSRDQSAEPFRAAIDASIAYVSSFGTSGVTRAAGSVSRPKKVSAEVQHNGNL